MLRNVTFHDLFARQLASQVCVTGRPHVHAFSALDVLWVPPAPLQADTITVLLQRGLYSECADPQRVNS